MLEDSVVWVARDITERKRAEEEVHRLNAELEDRVAERTARLESALAELEERERVLRESKDRYQAVVEQSAEGIFLFDAETKEILEANAAFQTMFGYTPREIAGLRVYDLIPQDPEGVDRNVERALKQRQILVGERSYRRKDGSAIEVEVSGGMISYGGKEVVCSIVRDITERKRAERALREVREAERNRMARELHDGALQDITYALAEGEIIRLLSEDPALDDRVNRLLEALRRGSRELRGMVFNLRLGEELDRPFSRQLESLVDQNRKMAPDLDVRLEVDQSLPSTPFEGTGAELLRALQEALTNVRRHAEASSVLLRVTVQGDHLLAEVSDDGRGFGPDTVPGVGFRSMRERIAALGGELEVQSEPGEGTRVRFRVPMGVLLAERPGTGDLQAGPR
ncbi:MAG: PAS domain S-box protein [Actinomycetota bacterium]|nr:PAS domain S-box protein [Actinomycetota bacterium]